MGPTHCTILAGGRSNRNRGMRSYNGCIRRSALTCGRGDNDIDRGRRRRPHPRPKAMPSVSLGHAWMFGFGKGWRKWEDFLFE